MKDPSMGGGGHMNEFEVAAYLDRRLPPGDRERVEGHLAGCRECREEVLQTQEALARGRRPKRLLIASVVLAAAATLAIVILPTIRPSGAGNQSETVRGAAGSPSLMALGPLGEAPAAGLRFVWGRAAGATIYRLTLSGADGVPLWTANTGDTTLALPDSVRLQTGKPYYWMIDALLGDGTTRSTGLHEFHPAR